MSFCGVSRTSTFIFVSLIFFFPHNITKWKRQFWFNYQWARISLTIVSVISIQTWPGAAFQLQPKRFQNQPRPGRVGREGHGSVSVQCGLDLPDEPALLLTPRIWKKTEWFISFFFFFIGCTTVVSVFANWLLSYKAFYYDGWLFVLKTG